MGHAGQSLPVERHADDKFAALNAAGVTTVKSLAAIGDALKEVTGWS